MDSLLVSRVERALETVFRRVGVTRVYPVDRAVRAAEFGTVGLTGAFVNLAVLLTLADRLPYVESAFAAFFGAAVWTFGLNSRYTFDATDRRVRRFARYIGVCTLGYLVYTTVLAAGLQWFAAPYWVASLPALTGGGLCNYVGSEWYALA